VGGITPSTIFYPRIKPYNFILLAYFPGAAPHLDYSMAAIFFPLHHST